MSVECVVSRSVKVNLGDYNGTDLFVSMKDTASDGEALKTQARLRRLVEAALVNDITRLFKARGKPISHAEIAKRYGLATVGK